MKILKSHFWYNKRQRNGVFFLILLVVMLQSVYFFLDFSSEDLEELNSPKILAFQKEIDSLKQIELEKRKPKRSKFNPSFITDFKGYELGMSTEEIDRLLEYRRSGKYINSAKKFQKVTGVSDSLLKVLAPRFKFPEWIKHGKSKISSSQKPIAVKSQIKVLKKDLNAVTAIELQAIKGIGVKLSERIVKYRKKLQGFSLNEQLYEVWYLKKEHADSVLKKYEVKQQPMLRKINVNTATFKEVLSVVYIDYNLAKKIFEYKDEVAEIQTLSELKKIDGFPIDKFARIALYLEAK